MLRALFDRSEHIKWRIRSWDRSYLYWPLIELREHRVLSKPVHFIKSPDRLEIESKKSTQVKESTNQTASLVTQHVERAKSSETASPLRQLRDLLQALTSRRSARLAASIKRECSSWKPEAIEWESQIKWALKSHYCIFLNCDFSFNLKKIKRIFERIKLIFITSKIKWIF